MTDADFPDRLDRRWDAVVRGQAGTERLEPAWEETIRRLHALEGTTMAEPRTAAIWQGTHSRIAAPVARPIPSPRPQPASSPPLWAALRWRPLNWLATAALLLLTLGGALLATRMAAPPTPTGQARSLSVDLYRVNTLNPNGWSLVQLDPQTLADLPPSAATPLAALGPGTPLPFSRPAGGTSWVAAADGSTFLRVDSVAVPARPGQPGWEVIVRDAVTGRRITSLKLRQAVYAVAVSTDGSRLVLWNPPDRPAVPWYTYVVEVPAGRILATISDPHPVSTWWPPGVTDPAVHRLYTLLPANPLATPALAGQQGGCPGQLVAYDAETGKIVARRNVQPGLCAGQQFQLVPTLVVSPDGSQVAVVAADDSLVTLLSASDLTVERTIALPAASTPSANPKPAAELYGFGAAAYAPDGQSLYLSGAESGYVQSRLEFASLLPVRRLDLATGTVVAENSFGASVLLPAPNGRDLYVYGTGPAGTFSLNPATLIVRRLDARTLATRAERIINEVSAIVVRPVRTTP